MAKKRLPRGGRKSFAVPAVKSMTDSKSAASAPKPDGTQAEKPTDEPSEELKRTIKAAYQ